MILRLAALAMFCGLAALPAHAAPRPYHAPRTAAGQPDLQGFWSNGSLTPLERAPGTPLTFATRAEEDAFARAALGDWREGEAGGPDGLGQGLSEWHPEFGFARIDGRLRTSWIVRPADGRLPWRPDALARFRALAAAHAGDAADNPEQRSVFDRCLVGGLGSANPPMLNPLVAMGKQIVQTGRPDRGEVAILSEMNHDVRVVRLGAPRLPVALRPWMGDSIGHWDGETLVVETTGFHPEEGFRGRLLISPDARVTERFTRTGPRTLLYAFEVDDPATYTQVWRGEMPLSADPGPIYEYACHEGDRDLEIFLAAARKRDAEARPAAR